jgi:hypothetical protein
MKDEDTTLGTSSTHIDMCAGTFTLRIIAE